MLRVRRCPAWAARTVVAAAAAMMLTGCQQAPAAESLREWTPADHHSTDDDKVAAARAQAQGGAASAGGARRTAPAAADDAAQAVQVAQLVDITWRQQCSTCHGPSGHGDGQMGPMLHASDLTSAEWQGRTSDAEMASVIKTGRNKMPRFDLPDSVVAGLVRRIRSFRVRP
jgi:cytochrome c oxidase cbb3-type subunit 3